MKDFEDYLQDKFIRENPTVLDDDIPDSFSEWIADSDPTDLIALAESYAEERVAEERERCAKVAETTHFSRIKRVNGIVEIACKPGICYCSEEKEFAREEIAKAIIEYHKGENL